MAWMDFLNHTCDIYHVVEDEKSPGYALPESPHFTYPEEPDVAGQICHFGIKSGSISTNQQDPANMLEVRDKLALPYGTDIRINDKIVNCETGYEYTAEQPITVKNNHHMYVNIKRIDRQKEL